jgi:hypothetical protein
LAQGKSGATAAIGRPMLEAAFYQNVKIYLITLNAQPLLQGNK